MADLETTTISNEGHVASSRLGDFRLTTDADDDAGPNPSAVLLADYTLNRRNTRPSGRGYAPSLSGPFHRH